MGRHVAAVAILAFGVAAGAARADGDPASDFLISQPLFVSFDRKPSPAAQADLQRTVDAAAAGHVPIRVALIATPYDLGSVGVLYRRPQRYAKFLGQELSYVYKGRLLVVMPNGYGLWRKRPLPRRELEAIARLPPPSSTDGTELAKAADRATRALLELHDVPVAVPKAAPAPKPGGTTTSDRFKILGAALLAAAAVAAMFAALRLRRRTDAT